MCCGIGFVCVCVEERVSVWWMGMVSGWTIVRCFLSPPKSDRKRTFSAKETNGAGYCGIGMLRDGDVYCCMLWIDV